MMCIVNLCTGVIEFSSGQEMMMNAGYQSIIIVCMVKSLVAQSRRARDYVIFICEFNFINDNFFEFL